MKKSVAIFTDRNTKIKILNYVRKKFINSYVLVSDYLYIDEVLVNLTLQRYKNFLRYANSLTSFNDKTIGSNKMLLFARMRMRIYR